MQCRLNNSEFATTPFYILGSQMGTGTNVSPPNALCFSLFMLLSMACTN